MPDPYGSGPPMARMAGNALFPAFPGQDPYGSDHVWPVWPAALQATRIGSAEPEFTRLVRLPATCNDRARAAADADDRCPALHLPTSRK